MATETIVVPAGKRGWRFVDQYAGPPSIYEERMAERRRARALRWARNQAPRARPDNAPAAWPFVERVGRGFFRLAAPGHIAQKAGEAYVD